MKDEEHLEVVGDQPDLLSWLLPGVAAAVGERADRWSYESFELGSPTAPEVRIELWSPTRDASIVLTAAASHTSGLFTAADPLRVSVRRASAPAPRGPVGTLLGRHPGRVDEVQTRLVEMVQRQSTPVPEAPEAGSPATGDPSDAGFGSRPGLPTSSRRTPRLRRPLIALVVLVAIGALTWGIASGGLASFIGGRSPSPGSSRSASPTAGKTTVIKGKKPKKATACRAKFTSTQTPRHSAKGNTSTTCGFAEEVRRAYIAAGKPGRTVKLPNVWSPKYSRFYPMTCKGRTTVTCHNTTKALVYLY